MILFYFFNLLWTSSLCSYLKNHTNDM